jgi:hypothetical protein
LLYLFCPVCGEPDGFPVRCSLRRPLTALISRFCLRFVASICIGETHPCSGLCLAKVRGWVSQPCRAACLGKAAAQKALSLPTPELRVGADSDVLLAVPKHHEGDGFTTPGAGTLERRSISGRPRIAPVGTARQRPQCTGRPAVHPGRRLGSRKGNSGRLRAIKRGVLLLSCRRQVKAF